MFLPKGFSPDALTMFSATVKAEPGPNDDGQRIVATAWSIVLGVVLNLFTLTEMVP